MEQELIVKTHTISTAISFQMDQEEDNIALEHQEHLDLMFTTGDLMPNTITHQQIKFKYIIAILMKHQNGDAFLMVTC